MDPHASPVPKSALSMMLYERGHQSAAPLNSSVTRARSRCYLTHCSVECPTLECAIMRTPSSNRKRPRGLNQADLTTEKRKARIAHVTAPRRKGECQSGSKLRLKCSGPTCRKCEAPIPPEVQGKHAIYLDKKYHFLCGTCAPEVDERMRAMETNREYCPICHHPGHDILSGEVTDAHMLQCTRCQTWVHPGCEHLDKATAHLLQDAGGYMCPACRDSKPGELIELPKRRCTLSASVRCAVCQRSERDLSQQCIARQLTAVLAARFGLPEGRPDMLICTECLSQSQSEEYCPICGRLYKDYQGHNSALEDMIQCHSCSRLVHLTCELLPKCRALDTHDLARKLRYSCAMCRDQSPGTGCVIQKIHKAIWLATDTCPICVRTCRADEASICCDRCDIWVHTTCEGLPDYFGVYFKRRGYYCPECRRELGRDQNLLSEIQHHCANVGCCVICFGEPGDEDALSEQGQNSDVVEWIECSECNAWVHAACENLPDGSSHDFASPDTTYTCPACSSEQPGRGV